MRLDELGTRNLQREILRGFPVCLEPTYLAGRRLLEETSLPVICWLLGIDMAKTEARWHIKNAAAWDLKTTIVNARSCGLGVVFP